MKPHEVIKTLIGQNEALRIGLRHMQIERDNAALRLEMDRLTRVIEKLQRQIAANKKSEAEALFGGRAGGKGQD